MIADYFKGIFTVLNLIIFMLLLAWLMAKLQHKKLSRWLVIATAFVFLLFSTPFLPKFLAGQMEEQYKPLNPADLKGKAGKIYIHLLGSGYSLDNRLPATAQLAPVAQCRLLEALRIYRQLDSSILVCSAGSGNMPESQASVARKAAMLLGADSSRIITLDKPTTTIEEAEALADRVGKDARVIIVTDALHMPRAYKFFSQLGFNPIAAPTNFQVLNASNKLRFRWAPSVNNIRLMDLVIHEFLGNIKASL